MATEDKVSYPNWTKEPSPVPDYQFSELFGRLREKISRPHLEARNVRDHSNKSLHSCMSLCVSLAECACCLRFLTSKAMWETSKAAETKMFFVWIVPREKKIKLVTFSPLVVPYFWVEVIQKTRTKPLYLLSRKTSTDED